MRIFRAELLTEYLCVRYGTEAGGPGQQSARATRQGKNDRYCRFIAPLLEHNFTRYHYAIILLVCYVCPMKQTTQ